MGRPLATCTEFQYVMHHRLANQGESVRSSGMTLVRLSALMMLCACSANPKPDTPESATVASSRTDAGTSEPRTFFGYEDGDPTLPRLRGQGWYCYEAQKDAEKSSICDRPSEECERSRAELAASEFEVTSCQRQETAACLFVTVIREFPDGRQEPVCAKTPSECEAHRMRFYASPDRYQFITNCKLID